MQEIARGMKPFQVLIIKRLVLTQSGSCPGTLVACSFQSDPVVTAEECSISCSSSDLRDYSQKMVDGLTLYHTLITYVYYIKLVQVHQYFR